MNIQKIFIPCLMLLLVCSCAMLQNLDVAQQEIMVRLATRTGTAFGIAEIVDGREEQLELAQTVKDSIVENVLPLLNEDNVSISSANMHMLLIKIPVNLRPFVAEALSIVDAYIAQANVSDHLDENAVRLLKAFFEGVVGGCDIILLGSGEAYDGMGSTGNTCAWQPSEGRTSPIC